MTFAKFSTLEEAQEFVAKVEEAAGFAPYCGCPAMGGPAVDGTYAIPCCGQPDDLACPKRTNALVEIRASAKGDAYFVPVAVVGERELNALTPEEKLIVTKAAEIPEDEKPEAGKRARR